MGSRRQPHHRVAQVVTCSGIDAQGSLRIVRNGVGLVEHSAAEMPGIRCSTPVSGLQFGLHAMQAIASMLAMTMSGTDPDHL